MKRGNNYSGARCAHSLAAKPCPTDAQPKPAAAGGLTLMGGSNRKREVWRDGKAA